MTTTDFIAILALVVATFTFALELKRWFDAGPKLRLSVMGDAVVVPDDGQGDRLALTAINYGDRPTTITHFLVFIYDGWWGRFRNKPTFTGLIIRSLVELPHELDVNKQFMGMMAYDERTRRARDAGNLYVGVVATHSRKNYVRRVPASSEKFPTKELASTP